MIVGPVTNFASPLQRDIYLVVVIAIVIFSGSVHQPARRAERNAGRRNFDCYCRAGVRRGSRIYSLSSHGAFDLHGRAIFHPALHCPQTIESPSGYFQIGSGH
jgi:hypothetical protein